MTTDFAQVNHVSICCNAKCEKKTTFGMSFFCYYCAVRCNVFSDGRRVFTVGNFDRYILRYCCFRLVVCNGKM